MILVIGGCFAGKLEWAKQTFKLGDDAVESINNAARKLFEDGMDYKEAAEFIYSNNSCGIVLTDEIGNGIVPIDKTERDFREWMGRVQIILAEKSEEVFRVICGIGQKIK